MVISSKGRYALRVMVDLAEHGGDGYVSMRDVARRQEISDKYAGQIMTLLSRADDNHSAKAKLDPLRGWIVVCSRCGKELTYTLPATEYWSADRGWVILQDR